MKITYINIGEIIAWIAAVILFATGTLDLQIFLLFVLLKFEFTLNYGEKK